MTYSCQEIDEIADSIKTRVLRLGYGSRKLSKAQKWAVLKTIHEYFGGEENRRVVCGWIFSDGEEMSAKLLTDVQWLALWRWINLWYDEEKDDWYPSEYFLRCVPYIANVAWRGHLGDLIPIMLEKGGVIVGVEHEEYNYVPILPIPLVKTGVDVSGII